MRKNLNGYVSRTSTEKIYSLFVNYPEKFMCKYNGNTK